MQSPSRRPCDRHKGGAVRGVGDALLKLAARNPLSKEVRGHVGVVNFADGDQFVLDTLHLNHVLFQKRLRAIGRGHAVHDLAVRESVAADESWARRRGAECSIDTDE